MRALVVSPYPPLHNSNSIFTTKQRSRKSRILCFSSAYYPQSKALNIPNRANALATNSISSLIDRYGIESSDKVPVLATKGENEDRESDEFDFRYGRVQVRECVGKIKSLPRRDVEELVEKVGVFNDVSEFNNMLMALVLADEHELAVKLFSKLTTCHQMVADSGTWSIMVRCYAKMNEPDGARRILGDMLRLGFTPSVATLTVLINSFCRRGKLQRAFEVFDVMRGIRVKPSVQTYNCLIKGLCYVGKVESAHELLMRIKESPIRPDIYSYTAVMDGFCKVGRSGEAMEFLKEAVELGFEPSVVTYNTLLNGYVKEGRPMEGIGILKQMQARRCRPDYISFSTLLHGLLKWGKVRTALQLSREMMSAGYKVDERMMNTLLRALCRMSWKEEELFKDVYDVFDIMRNRNYDIYPCAYSLVVQTLCIDQNIDKALVNLHEMLRRELFPRMIVFNSVIRILCCEGRVDEAIQVLIILYERRRVPSIISYNLLIDGLNRQRRWLEACSVFGAALKLGVSPHKKPRKAQPVKRYLFY
ncbi:hypothetical protein QQ045_003085 [Rhodiola kirilowii]